MTRIRWAHKVRYGSESSYIVGMSWLDECLEVEDWGCSKAYSKRYCRGQYRGIDGTPGAADEVAELNSYRSSTPGLFMRHVLEHNEDWRLILQNALDSFTQRMVLIVHRDFADEDIVNRGKRPEQLDLDISAKDLGKMIEGYCVATCFIRNETTTREAYDTLFFLEKSDAR